MKLVNVLATSLLVSFAESVDADPPAAPPFGEPVSIAGDFHLASLDAGDLDGDGWVDIIGANTALQISVYRNNAGTLVHDQHLPFEAIQFVLEARIANLDGDDRPDIIAIGGGAINHQLYFQQPNRTFLQTDSGIPGEFYFPNFDLEDMDGDRDIDLITINPFAVHLNDGTGHFVTQGQSQSTPIFDAASIGNVNNDGAMDFLRITAVPGVVESMTNTGGVLTSASSHALDHDSHYAFADFTGDGLTDVASIRYDQPSGSTLLVLTSNGNGTFSGPVESQFVQHPQKLFAGDINADGIIDLVGHLPGATSLQFMLGAGDGTFVDGGQYDGVPAMETPFVEEIFDLVFTDIDRDNDVDIVLAAWQMGLVVIPNETAIDEPADITGNGTVDVFDLLALLSAWGSCSLCPEDINQSGVVDVFDLLMLLGAWG